MMNSYMASVPACVRDNASLLSVTNDEHFETDVGTNGE